MTRYFVDPEGNYLGGYDGPDDGLPDRLKGMEEVPTAPDHARQPWRNGAWGAIPEAAEAEPSDTDVLLEALKEKVAPTTGELDAAKDRLRQQRGAKPASPGRA